MTTPYIYTGRRHSYIIPNRCDLLVDGEHISENVIAACYPRILRGDAANGVAYNPLTDLLEVRRNWEVIFKGDSMMECRNAGHVFDPAVPPVALSTPVAPKPAVKSVMSRQQRDEHRTAVAAFWKEARTGGHIAKSRLETKEQREARLACVAAWCGLPELESLSDLGADQVRSVTAAMRRGEILPGWQIREMAA